MENEELKKEFDALTIECMGWRERSKALREEYVAGSKANKTRNARRREIRQLLAGTGSNETASQLKAALEEIERLKAEKQELEVA